MNLTSGAVRARFELSGPSLLNDVAVLPDGRAVVTESLGDRLLVTRDRELVPVVPAGTLLAPNGIVAAADGARVYVATFRGIFFVVDVAAGTAAPLQLPARTTSLAGIDGLYRDGDALIGIQNAVGRPRIVRIALAAGGAAGRVVEVLESSSPIVDNPTTGAIAGDRFVFLARRNREAVVQAGALASLEDIVIASIPLR